MLYKKSWGAFYDAEKDEWLRCAQNDPRCTKIYCNAGCEVDKNHPEDMFRIAPPLSAQEREQVTAENASSFVPGGSRRGPRSPFTYPI